MIYLRLISLFTIFTSLALAQTSTRSGISALETGNVGDGCVDPREFASCFKQTEDAFVDCGVRCNITRPSPDCILQCGKTRDAGNFGCAIENCWNQVYSCEYQLMALNFILSNDLIHDQPIVPFYPPPPGAEGACSCNIGNMWSNLTSKVDGLCDNFIGTGGNNLDWCHCCAFSGPISSAIQTCPTTDLSILGLIEFIDSMRTTTASIGMDCAPILNSDACSREVGMQLGSGSGSQFYDLNNLPSGVPGTQEVSDVGSFTTFPGPQTTTVSIFGGYQSVLTMKPWTAGSGGTGVPAADLAAGGGSEPGSGSGSGSGGSSGSSGGGSNGVGQLDVRWNLAALIAGLLAIAYM